MKIIWLLLTLIPTLVEGFLDRRGESKKGKVKDTIWLVVVAAVLTGCAYLFLDEWIAVPLLILMWRLTVFDYIVNAFLKRFSEGHKKINIWKFTGTTTWFWDQWVSKIDWRVRLSIRAVLLVLALVAILKL